jgi:hypothetical protein
MNRALTALALLVTLLPCSSAHSFFRPPETVIAPADRLIENL